MPDPPPGTLPYRDRQLPIDERVDDLLARMTVAEKVAQLGRTGQVPVHHNHRAGGGASMTRVREPGTFTFSSGPTTDRQQRQAQVELEGPVAPYAECAVVPTCVTLDGA